MASVRPRITGGVCRTRDGDRQDLFLKRLVEMQYKRDTLIFTGVFRVRGRSRRIPGLIEVALRFFGDTIDAISEIDPISGKPLRRTEKALIHPASHYVTTKETLKRANGTIREELRERLVELKSQGKLLEAQRIEQRTLYDLEFLEEMGYCPGIENYSRHITGRLPGEAPFTLIDYFPEDFLVFIDESHISIPQINGMYHGDRSRKTTLINFGFRLPSALDNRPLRFEEFEKRMSQVVYVSATPAEYEFRMSGDHIVEQIIRPTGLMDPEIEVGAASQVDDLRRDKTGQERAQVACNDAYKRGWPRI